MQTPDVVELMLNADGRVWVDRLGKGMAPISTMAAATAEYRARLRPSWRWLA